MSKQNLCWLFRTSCKVQEFGWGTMQSKNLLGWDVIVWLQYLFSLITLLFNQHETTFMAKALNDLAHVPMCSTKKSNKIRGLMVTIACTWRQLVHAVPKPRAKTSKNSWMKPFGINTSPLYKGVFVCACACLRECMPNVEQNTNICNRECDLKCKQLEINHSPRKCVRAFTRRGGAEGEERSVWGWWGRRWGRQGFTH